MTHQSTEFSLRLKQAGWPPRNNSDWKLAWQALGRIDTTDLPVRDIQRLCAMRTEILNKRFGTGTPREQQSTANLHLE